MIDTKFTSKSGKAKTKKRHLDFNYELLNYFGLWPNVYQNLPVTSWQSIRRLLPPLQIAKTSVVLVYYAIGLCLLWREPHLRTSIASLMVGCVVTIVKLGVLVYNKKGIANIFDSFEMMNEDALYIDEKCENLRKKVERWSRKLSKIFISLGLTTSLLIFTVGWKLAFRTLMQPLNALFPEKTFWFYLIQYLTLPMMLMSVVDLFTMATMDVTGMVLLMQGILQFHILGYQLENIRIIVNRVKLKALATNSVAANEAVMESQENELNDVHPKEISFSAGSERSRERTVTSRAKLDTIEADIEIEMEIFLENLAKHHQALIEICAEVQRISNPVLIIQMVLAGTLSVMALYISILSNKVGGVNGEIVISAFLMVIGTIELFALCLLCDVLTEKSASIREAAYACDWLEATEGFKQSLRIIMSRSSKPVVVKAIGIPLSLRSFKTVMRAVYYAHTMSLNIINGNKIIN